MESENMFLLNDDVLVEVLTRLPPKSVLRLKCVSSHWRHLISSPCFLRHYAACSANRGAGRLLAFFQEAMPVRETWEPREAVPCNTLPICKELITENNVPEHVGGFVNYSNGLILCCRIRYGHHATYHVGNPLTGKFVELPQPSALRSKLSLGSEPLLVGQPCALVCEEDNSNEVATATATYSVVRVGMNVDAKSVYIDSYSSKTGKWSPQTLLAAPQKFSVRYVWSQPAVVARGGIVYWYTSYKDILVYNPKGKGAGNPHLQLIYVPKKEMINESCSVTRTCDDVLWLGLMHRNRHDLRFYMLPPPKHGVRDDVVVAKEWVLVHEVSFFALCRMMKKGLVACKYKESKLECLIPESRSEVVAVLRQGEKLFLYNVQRESLAKVDYSGRYNEDNLLCPYLQSSSLSSYCL